MFSRRSNSISKSPGPSSPKEPLLLSRDISRSESLRSSSSCSQQIFRPCDLIHGEVLGKGFFGQAIKVREVPKHSSFTLITAVSAYLGILCHCLGGLCPADSDRSWHSPGLLSEIHFSVSFLDHECLWLQAVLTLSPLNVNLGHTYSSPELDLELQSACVTAATWVRWENGEQATLSVKSIFLMKRCVQPQYSISCTPLVSAFLGVCQADVVTISEPPAEPKWLVSVVVVVRSCMTLTIKISINSSSLVFKLSGLEWGCFSRSYPGIPHSVGGSFFCLTKVL